MGLVCDRFLDLGRWGRSEVTRSFGVFTLCRALDATVAEMTTRQELQDELKACEEELAWLQAQPRECATAVRLLTREARRLRYRNEH